MSTQTQGEAMAGSSPQGSLQSLNFGMFSVDQLATLINWGNESDYKPPICNPWVKIDLAEEPAPHAPIKQPDEQPPASETVTEESSAPAVAASGASNIVAEVETADTSAAASEVAAEPSAAASDEDDRSTLQAAAERFDDTLEDAAVETSVEPTAAGEPAVEETPPSPVRVAAAEVAAAEVAAAEVAAAEVAAADVAAAEVTAADVAAADVAAGVAAADAADSATAVAVSAPRPIRTSFAKPMIMKQAPQQRPSMPDDYLKRLESLVLELNLQLARVSFEGEDSGADYTQWLSQRVIDLSLENMSLQEELQKIR